ncbi:MAG: LacI family DNA-binding transcriptional regulator [Bacteroidetes bacterium]|nr:LacI family DNA-binding transcriptional regulator [Bacteroidota bacterium]
MMTIVEIAKQLNVSPSTVSRALNDSYEISQKTKQRIAEFVKKVNFHPNPQATSLKRGSAKTIAVIIPDISNHFFSLALDAIEEIANRNRYHVLIYQTHDKHDREVDILKGLYSGRVDGVMISVADSSEKDFSHIENLGNSIPIVFFDRVIDKAGIRSITCNDYESGLKATEHLIRKKCSNILFIGISEQLSVTNARLKGYTDALEKNGLKAERKNILLCKNETEAQKIIGHALINLKPDGIFSTVERYTLLLYDHCHKLNITIPEQLKIISFFNSPTAALLSPPLSSIAHPAVQIGRVAAETMFQKLKKKKSFEDKDVVIDCTFQLRKSSQ